MSITLTLMKKHWFVSILVLIWFVLFQSALQGYGGSKWIYILFSCISMLNLVCALFRNVSFGYLFLSSFLWLGFWFKLSANIFLFGFFEIAEPAGAFNCSAASWDAVLLAGISASFGLIIGRVITSLFRIKPLHSLEWISAPYWYHPVRKILWGGVFFTVLASAVLNTALGIHRIGVAPQTILPWPGNAALAWVLNIGGAIAVATLVAWDISCRKNINFAIAAVVGVSFISAVSILSRSIYLFQVAAFCLVLLFVVRKTEERRKMLLIWGPCIMLCLIASVYLVSLQRDALFKNTQALAYQATQVNLVEVSASCKWPSPSDKSVPSFRMHLLYQLLIGRWIGIEGAMVAVGHPTKNIELVEQMLYEYRELGKPGIYQEISKSGYQVPDANFQFATLPGVVGFLYLSGKLWLISLGMLLVGLFVIVSERIVVLATRNLFLCSLYGIGVASMFSQFGVAPRQDLPQYFIFFAAVGVISIVQFWPSKNQVRTLRCTNEEV